MNRVGVQILTGLGSFFNVRMGGDDFSFQRPTFVSLNLIFLSFILFTPPTRADVDLTLGASARSYPLSAITSVDLGLSTYLWGSSGSSPWYGYSRAEISGSTVGIFNSGQIMAELFPLSFLGGRAGGESMQNDQDYVAYDCEGLRCTGRFYRTFAEAELSLGAGPIFAQGRWRRERWTQKKDPEPLNFIDPTSGLIMTGSGDSQTVYHGVMGLRLSPQWALAVGLRYAENQNRELSRFPFAMLRYQKGLFSAGLGGGIFQSELKAQSGSAVGFLRWEIWPSPALR